MIEVLREEGFDNGNIGWELGGDDGSTDTIYRIVMVTLSRNGVGEVVTLFWEEKDLTVVTMAT